MKIAFFEVEPWEVAYFEKKLGNHTLFFDSDPLTEKTIKKALDADIVSVFIYSKLTKKVIDALPRLKSIATRSTGFDHIDVRACNKRKVILSTVPTYGENTVAEHTFALLLNLTRKIHKSWDRTRKLDFSDSGLRGTDLKGKTIGVVGVGNIGKHVIRIANGFEMNVIAFDVNRKKALEKKLGFTYVGFDQLLKKSDVISLHCPYNKKTHHLISKKNIKKMKKGAMLINTARGGLVETGALLEALDRKILGGAGLDVLEEECYVQEDIQVMSKHFPKKCDVMILAKNHILATKENVIITSHNAFNSKEALQRILDTTIDNIRGFVRKKPINTV